MSRGGVRFPGLSVAGVCLVCELALPGCASDILHDLDEGSANQAVSALDRAGIPASKTSNEGALGERYAVRVPNRDATHALEVLGGQGLPREPRQGFAQLYARPALIPSATEERARFLLATVGELERTLETVDGVLGARVHLVPAEPDPNALDGRERAGARAAILLRTRPGRLALTPGEIQQLVAGSVPGLEASAVSVIFSRTDGRPAAEPVALSALGPFVVARESRALMITISVIAFALIGILSVLLLMAMKRRPPSPT